jgi:hypothetical protein
MATAGTLVDTGYGSDATRELWEQVLAGPLGGRPVRRIVVTHFHPDHVGNADWLSRRTGACVWMTAAEYLSAHAARDDAAGFDRTTSLAFFGRNGLDIAGHPGKPSPGQRVPQGRSGAAPHVPPHDAWRPPVHRRARLDRHHRLRPRAGARHAPRALTGPAHLGRPGAAAHHHERGCLGQPAGRPIPWHRVQPHRPRPGVEDALHPHLSRLLVPVLDAAAGCTIS